MNYFRESHQPRARARQTLMNRALVRPRIHNDLAGIRAMQRNCHARALEKWTIFHGRRARAHMAHACALAKIIGARPEYFVHVCVRARLLGAHGQIIARAHGKGKKCCYRKSTIKSSPWGSSKEKRQKQVFRKKMPKKRHFPLEQPKNEPIGKFFFLDKFILLKSLQRRKRRYPRYPQHHRY